MFAHCQPETGLFVVCLAACKCVDEAWQANMTCSPHTWRLLFFMYIQYGAEECCHKLLAMLSLLKSYVRPFCHCRALFCILQRLTGQLPVTLNKMCSHCPRLASVSFLDCVSHTRSDFIEPCSLLLLFVNF